MLKIKDLKIKKKIWDKHKNTVRTLYIITYIIFLPFVLLMYFGEFIERICNKMSWIREKIVYTIFKIIYKKEIITNTVEKV